MYFDQLAILSKIEVFISQNEDNSALMKDVSEDMSLNHLVLISNVNQRFKKNRSHRNTIIDHNMYRLKPENTAIFYKFHFHWAIYLVLKN